MCRVKKMVLISTHIDRDTHKASIEIRVENYSVTYTFPAVPSCLRDTFDFRYFEYFYYLYRGVNSELRSHQTPLAGGMTLKDGVLTINVNSSQGNTALQIPHDDRIKKLMYECACMYLQYHKSKTIPMIYSDILEEDRAKFE